MLVSITADIGSIAVATALDRPAYVNQHIALCRPKDSVHRKRSLNRVSCTGDANVVGPAGYCWRNPLMGTVFEELTVAEETLDAIAADILAIEKEAHGLLDGLLKMPVTN